MPVALVTFDLDETLVDDSGLPAALHRVGERIAVVRPSLDPDRFVEANRRVWQEYWPEVEQDWLLDTRAGEEILVEGWRRTLAACGHPDEDLVRIAVRSYEEEAARAVKAYPDVLPALDGLAAAGVPVGLVSNGSAGLQRAKLRAAGLEGRFAVVVISSEVGSAKPDASLFRAALSAVGAAPEESWHIGDNLSRDVAGAEAAGMRTAWLNRKGRPLPAGAPVPDAKLPDLVGLSAMLLHPTGPGYLAGAELE